MFSWFYEILRKFRGPYVDRKAVLRTSGTAVGDIVKLLPARIKRLPSSAYIRSIRIYSPEKTLATGNGSQEISYEISVTDIGQTIRGVDTLSYAKGTLVSEADKKVVVDGINMDSDWATNGDWASVDWDTGDEQ